ncbi:MAG: carbohydrate deacetylase [Defluviitaleaceae bacterium]|nr:carbohydrate deacetylase [Defluviitaleaceae bacterium]
MTKLIINADDFGYSNGVNYGIIDAHKYGMVTSATLMVTMPGVSHAVSLMRENPLLAVGLHLNISLGAPLTTGKTLVGDDGNFIKPHKLKEGYKYDFEELKAECCAQYNKFVELTGKNPSHIDSHLATHEKIDEMKEASSILAEKKGIPLRSIPLKHTKHVEFIQHRTFGAKPGLDYIIDNLDNIIKHDFVEIMCHPAYVDAYLMENSSYNTQRLGELEFLLAKDLPEKLKAKGMVLTNYYEAVYRSRRVGPCSLFDSPWPKQI